MLRAKSLLFKQLGYKPLIHQLEFHNSFHKYKGYIGGLGSGKTHAGVFEAIYYILAYPGITGFILAPTNKILKDSTIKAFFKYCPSTIIKYYNRSEQKVVFKNGSIVLFRNGETERDVDRLRNIEVGWFWADEARGFPAYVWKVLVGRLREKGGPLVGFITTTPKGRNWIYIKFDSPKKSINYFAAHSSSTENIYLPKDYLQNLKEEYSGKFAQQEIDGKYVGFEGTVYLEFTRQDHVINNHVLIKDRNGQLGISIPDTDFKVWFKEIVLGVDWGFTNPLGIPVVGIDNDDRMYIIDEFYESHIKKVLDPLNNYKDKYNFRMSFADPSEPKLIDEVDDGHIPIQKAVNDIIPGISEVSNRLKVREDGKPRLYVCANCVNTIKEFENYRYPDKKEDRPEQEKPLKVLDHLMDAIRYVAMGIKTTKTLGFDQV